ncbi:hypothetical protein, partial [Pseudomonas allii]|uniref:hypothetical protein n=1 Tax=Pseudomonas allii TaxID=2740531 RepID=UPI0019667B63
KSLRSSARPSTTATLLIMPGGEIGRHASVQVLVTLTVVEVRVFSWAPNSDQTRESGFFRFRGLKTSLSISACIRT